jgi:DNA-binding MltR family transcriptional regulator
MAIIDWVNQYNEIVTVYRNESDRGAAILAASFLDNEITKRLKGFLVEHRDMKDLFKGYGPLNSFSAKIDISFAFGLLTLEMKSDLNLIRKVRNHFAHYPADTIFNASPIKEYCANLTTAKGIPLVDGRKLQKETPRDQFLFAVALAIALFDRAVSAEPARTIPKHAVQE